jgi:hypothetical protein
MFDESSVVSMRYDDAGKFLGADVEPDAAAWIKRRDTALASAVPFREWWEQHSSE